MFKELVLPTVAEFEEMDLVNIHQCEDFKDFDYDKFYTNLPKSL